MAFRFVHIITKKSIGASVFVLYLAICIDECNNIIQKYFLNIYLWKLINHAQNHKLQPASTTTTLPTRRVGWNRCDIFDATNFHTRTSKCTQSRLRAWARCFCFVSSCSPQFNVKRRDTKGFALFSYILLTRTLFVFKYYVWYIVYLYYCLYEVYSPR